MSAHEPDDRVWDKESVKLLMAFMQYKWDQERATWGDQA
mgnify:CR=1 FL=1|tara:strand:- start:1381 stop:1497 length:117 start_codon:yes stop_codon:yes gene_type:complete